MRQVVVVGGGGGVMCSRLAGFWTGMSQNSRISFLGLVADLGGLLTLDPSLT